MTSRLQLTLTVADPEVELYFADDLLPAGEA